MRGCRLALCKSLVVGRPAVEARELARLISSPIAAPDLLALAPKIESTLVPVVEPLEAAHIMRLFRDRDLRHEPLLLNCAWKTFKAPIPCPATELSKLATATATAWQIVTRFGLTHDHQLVALGLGRVVELLPQMLPLSIAHVLDGLIAFDRHYFSLTEVSAYDDSKTMTSPTAISDPLEGTDGVVPNQPNLIDVALSQVEDKFSSMSVDDICAAYTARDVLTTLAAFGKFGVRREGVVAKIAEVAKRTEMTPTEVAHVLLESVRVHSRIVDMLEEEGNEGAASVTSCAPLFSMLAHRLAEMNMHHVARSDPLLILSLRRLCESNEVVTKEVPALWNKIRGLRIAHRHTTALETQERQRRREGSYLAQKPGVGRQGIPAGRLQEPAFRVKLQPIVRDSSKDERFVPPQFKSWHRRTSAFAGNRAAAARRQPVLKRFGSRRVTPGHLHAQRDKWARRVR